MILMLGLGWTATKPTFAQDAAGSAPRTGLIADLPLDAKMFPTPKDYFSSPIQRKVYKAYRDRQGMGRLPVNTLTPEACVTYTDPLTTCVYVPPTYDGTKPFGVYLHNSPHPSGIRPSEGWKQLMQEL
ncbi:MAG: hypothetical protein GX615_12220, partial [Lentisphaerae bacterium]|nr:hypothetical protein [Lentisphaerota bacterium]